MTRELFRIETDRVTLTWASQGSSTPVPSLEEPPPGRLVLRKTSTEVRFREATRRADLPDGADDPESQVGPRLFEQSSYAVYARSRDGEMVEVRHRDPVILRGLNHAEEGTVHHGTVNFRNQVGLSTFHVVVGGRPEFEFDVEVFPSKLDYRSDYQYIMAEVQEILTGLVVEYLRSTFQLGAAAPVPEPTHVEWLTLLRNLMEELDDALNLIRQRPSWGLKREDRFARPEKLRRIDSHVRRAVLKGRGAGPRRRLSSGRSVRTKIPERQPHPTLDTPEHRWLAAQLKRIRRGLARLQAEERRRLAESQYDTTLRQQGALSELQELERRIVQLERIPALDQVTELPPAGFVSLVLLTRPGYREAYRSCLALSLGLRLTGGPMELSLKDLHELYEYWCYLALLRVISERTGQDLPADRLLSVEQEGLRVQVQRGRQHSVSFDLSGDRKITVTYNPRFGGGAFLVPQQPDLLITLEDEEWPRIQLVADAKYRVDGSEAYLKQKEAPGPPDDAINVLHRYRDAILDLEQGDASDLTTKRTVIEGCVLYPHHPEDPAIFRESRLWTSLDRIGIGALPFLPDDTGLVQEWIAKVLDRGGWAQADRVIPYRSEERARDWRVAASQPVLVGVLRGGYEERHLDWVRANQLYYMPYLQAQRRQLAAKWVAVYSPTALRTPGAVTHAAEVLGIEVVDRDRIETPWGSGGRGRQQVLYQLGSVNELEEPIENLGQHGRGTRFSTHRWTSRLGLLRAGEVTELFLETEPEWRLHEELRARGVSFRLEPGQVKLQDVEDPSGRAWFVVQEKRLQYRGAAGFFGQDSATSFWPSSTRAALYWLLG